MLGWIRTIPPAVYYGTRLPLCTRQCVILLAHSYHCVPVTVSFCWHTATTVYPSLCHSAGTQLPLYPSVCHSAGTQLPLCTSQCVILLAHSYHCVPVTVSFCWHTAPTVYQSVCQCVILQWRPTLSKLRTLCNVLWSSLYVIDIVR